MIPEEMRNDFLWATSCELLGDGKYILRHYWTCGGKHWEAEYQNKQKHGKEICWRRNGDRYWEQEYQNGQLHGKLIEWDVNRDKCWEAEWKNGEFVRITL